MKRAQELAASLGARLVLPSRPLLERTDCFGYFTHTDVKATQALFAPKAAVIQLPRRKAK